MDRSKYSNDLNKVVLVELCLTRKPFLSKTPTPPPAFVDLGRLMKSKSCRVFTISASAGADLLLESQVSVIASISSHLEITRSQMDAAFLFSERIFQVAKQRRGARSKVFFVMFTLIRFSGFMVVLVERLLWCR